MLPTLWRNSNALAGSSWDNLFDSLFFRFPAVNVETENSWLPRVDVHDTEKEVVIDAELPGVDKKDIKVEVKDQTLTLAGERKYEEKTEKDNYHRIERRYGKFSRTFSLPKTIDAGKVKAKYTNGILTLTLPKKEEAKPKEIQVEVS